MQHVLFLIPKVGNEFLRTVNFYVLGGQRVVAVEIMEFARIFEIYLQGAGPDPFGVLCVGVNFVLVQPLEVSDRKGLAHRPPVKVISVQVLDVCTGFVRVVVFHVFVVGLRVPVRYRRNSPANAFLEEQVHVAVRKKFEFHARHQHGVPGQGRRGDVMGGIQLILSKAYVDETFEDVC